MILVLEDAAERDVPYFDLRAEKAISIEPLCMGVIPHPTFLKARKHPVMLISRHGVFAKRNLWIENTVIPEGKVYTNVFNMGNSPIKVRKGDIISQLIEMYIPEPPTTMSLVHDFASLGMKDGEDIELTLDFRKDTK